MTYPATGKSRGPTSATRLDFGDNPLHLHIFIMKGPPVPIFLKGRMGEFDTRMADIDKSLSPYQTLMTEIFCRPR